MEARSTAPPAVIIKRSEKLGADFFLAQTANSCSASVTVALSDYTVTHPLV